MAPKKGGENTKKAAGNARKAEAAASKKAAEDAKKAAVEDEKWQKGAKTNAKKEAEAAKKAEAARKKAEKDALMKEEEASLPSKPKGGAKGAAKKGGPSRGTLDLSQLDAPSKKASALSASGIDNALDALSLDSKAGVKVDKHPERRYKAAYAAYEARRMPEIEEEHPGLRKNQREQIIRKEFEKSDENPFNQVNVAYNASREDVEKIKEAEKAKIEARLTARS
ncbi:hypothetical protein KEM55_004319 [Ascosphaera atra]|nr:hypothetical protein KEM55_005508 [Ascosphaera atra]KAI5309004.1 hypothetical protein KEM55_004319 [Ascosphaera atra]